MKYIDILCINKIKKIFNFPQNIHQIFLADFKDGTIIVSKFIYGLIIYGK